MKKVTILMIAIILVFFMFTYGVLMYRHQNFCAGTLQSLVVAQADRYSDLHINQEGKLNINKATLEELCNLNGIGEVLASRIVQYREEHGPYKTIEELINIKGIGEVKLKNIADFIYIE